MLFDEELRQSHSGLRRGEASLLAVDQDLRLTIIQTEAGFHVETWPCPTVKYSSAIRARRYESLEESLSHFMAEVARRRA